MKNDQVSNLALNNSNGALSIGRLTINNFRNYTNAVIEPHQGLVLITGDNGAGKTNLLEAISYLAPGRGLRGARLSDLARIERVGHDADMAMEKGLAWAVNAKISNNGLVVDIGTGCEKKTNDKRDRRIIKVDGLIIKKQAELGNYSSVLWLTPQMDRLFIEGSSGRRRFIDRLIMGLESDHLNVVSAYNQSLKGRNKILKEGSKDEGWLSSLEQSMVGNGVAMAARRLDFSSKLNQLSERPKGCFPGAQMAMTGVVEEWLQNFPAVEVEEMFLAELEKLRSVDRKVGITQIGPHKADLVVHHIPNNTEAKFCSTGEQKALLIRLVLAATELQILKRGRIPILLLDEICAHLDEDRRAALFEVISEMGVQAWMTGTDELLFKSIGQGAQKYKVNNSKINQLK